MTITEHCGGDCVERHENQHSSDDQECCRRVGVCLIDAAGNAAKEAACNTAYNTYLASTTDWTECNAYTVEVDCLTELIANECSGESKSASTGAIIGGSILGVAGGILGGIGGFLLGGVGGAIAGSVGGALLGGLVGGGIGAGIGYLAGGVSSSCCTTLASELTTAQSRKLSHCAAAAPSSCTLRADGTVI